MMTPLNLGPNALYALLTPEAAGFDERFGVGSWHALVRCVGQSTAQQLAGFNRAEIIDLLRDTHGATQEQIANVLGVTRQRVQQIKPGRLEKPERVEVQKLNKLRTRLIKLGVPADDHRKWLWNELVGRGRTQIELAHELRVSQAHLSECCRELGIRLDWRQSRYWDFGGRQGGETRRDEDERLLEGGNHERARL